MKSTEIPNLAPGTMTPPAMTAATPRPEVSTGRTAPQSAMFGALALMLVLSGLDQTILSTALPVIAAALPGRELAPWVFSSHLLASTAVIPLYGKLADRFGSRPLLMMCTSLFLLGSVACAAATTMPALVAARALQGLGGGGLMTLTLLATASLYGPEERGRRMAMLGAAFGLSTLAGPVVGALLLQVLPWQAAFLLNIPGAAFALLVLARADLGGGRTQQRPMDSLGAALLAAALVALLLAIRREGLGNIALISGFPAAALACTLLLAWVWVELHAADPVLPLGLFRHRTFAAAGAVSLLSGVPLFCGVVFVPVYLQQGLGLGVLASALHTLPLMLGITVGGQLAGCALRSGMAPRRLAGLAATGIKLGFALAALVLWRAHLQPLLLAGALLPVGLGLGLLFPLVTVLAQRGAPAAHMGVATAVPVMLRSLGGAVGVAVMGEMLHADMLHAQAIGLHSQAQAAHALAGGVASLCGWAAAAGVATFAASRWLPIAIPAITANPA